MKTSIRTNRFKKDWKRMEKRGYKFDKLANILRLIESEEPLPEKCRPHILSGDWDGYWECHIASDWLLIWEDTGDSIILVATGTHSDLF